MKRTEITYTKTMDGKIMIKDIKNVATLDQIEKEFGEKIKYLYGRSTPHYYMCTFSYNNYINILNNERYKLAKGDVMTKEYFNHCINGMKAAGNRLQKIKETVESYKEKTITI